MKTNIKVLVLLFLMSVVSFCIAEEKAVLADETVEANQELSFPYVAAITEDNVYIRSGPGTNHYPCGKVQKGDKVKAVSSQYSWTRIIPPKGSFSWISRQYVDYDPTISNVGVVTGDSVRVYAGSDDLKPIYSTTIQVKLNTGERVVLIAADQKDYYKISPPVGAYLWVSTQFTRGIEGIDEPGDESQFVEIIEKKVARADYVKSRPTSVAATSLSAESEKLKEYYILKENVEVELAKDFIQQDYTDIKRALSLLVEDKQSGKAGRYAKFTMDQIERYELAYEVEKAVRLQDAQFARTKKAIEAARQERIASVPQMGRYAAVGLFQVSNIYGSEAELRHYIVLDKTGKIFCYALPHNSAKSIKLDNFIGKYVGIIGEIKPFIQTKNTLVHFTEIDILE